MCDIEGLPACPLERTTTIVHLSLTVSHLSHSMRRGCRGFMQHLPPRNGILHKLIKSINIIAILLRREVSQEQSPRAAAVFALPTTRLFALRHVCWSTRSLTLLEVIYTGFYGGGSLLLKEHHKCECWPVLDAAVEINGSYHDATRGGQRHYAFIQLPLIV